MEQPPKLIGIVPNNIAPPAVMERPEVVSCKVELRFRRDTAEKIFPALKFSEGETEAIITEVLRPIKKGEPHTHIHTASGVKFCVDHYELDGVTL